MIVHNTKMEKIEQHILGLIYDSPGIHRVQIIRDMAHYFNGMYNKHILNGIANLLDRKLIIAVEYKLLNDRHATIYFPKDTKLTIEL